MLTCLKINNAGGGMKKINGQKLISTGFLAHGIANLFLAAASYIPSNLAERQCAWNVDSEQGTCSADGAKKLLDNRTARTGLFPGLELIVAGVLLRRKAKTPPANPATPPAGR
jgi:hypothetical protein